MSGTEPDQPAPSEETATLRETPTAASARRVVCYAHRGARGHAPENTLLAFALAFDLGADAIECDVQRSRDGQLVIIHDDTVDRTTGGSGRVAAHTLAELRALDAGRRWGIPQRISTLDETLALVRARGGGINLEIKGESIEQSVDTARAVEPALRALDANFRARLLVSSFAHPAIRVLKERLPWLRVGAVYGGTDWKRRDMLAPALEMGAEAIHPDVGLVSRELITAAHTLGLRVNVWTANRWATIRRLSEWEVDGIFSDYPERVVIARAQMSTTLARQRSQPASE
jgi:glycerophosphoryl diester phosphodiesterase